VANSIPKEQVFGLKEAGATDDPTVQADAHQLER
jgi:hypothetical protein